MISNCNDVLDQITNIEIDKIDSLKDLTDILKNITNTLTSSKQALFDLKYVPNSAVELKKILENPPDRSRKGEAGTLKSIINMSED